MPQAQRGTAGSMEKIASGGFYAARRLPVRRFARLRSGARTELCRHLHCEERFRGHRDAHTQSRCAERGQRHAHGLRQQQPAGAGARRGRRPARHRGQQLRHALPDGSSQRRGAEHRAHRVRPGWKAEPAARERAAPRESPGQDRSPKRAAQRGAYPERLVQLHLPHQRQSQYGAPGLHAQRVGQADARQAGALARAERDAGVLPRWHQLVAAAAAACGQLWRLRRPPVARQRVCAVRLALTGTDPIFLRAALSGGKWGLSLFFCAALAQPYPAKPVTFIVPFAPGGGTDITARTMAAKLSQKWGQWAVVENRGGAGGVIGTDVVAKARPDGYTLLIANVGITSINPALYPKLPYDADRAFAPISLICELPFVLMASPKFAPNSVQELVTFARANPEKVTYASSGQGGSPHLTAELFQLLTATKMTHVPYKGGGPAMIDLMAGHVDILFASVLEGSGHIKAGELEGPGGADPEGTGKGRGGEGGRTRGVADQLK